MRGLPTYLHLGILLGSTSSTTATTLHDRPARLQHRFPGSTTSGTVAQTADARQVPETDARRAESGVGVGAPRSPGGNKSGFL